MSLAVDLSSQYHPYTQNYHWGRTSLLRFSREAEAIKVGRYNTEEVTQSKKDGNGMAFQNLFQWEPTHLLIFGQTPLPCPICYLPHANMSHHNKKRTAVLLAPLQCRNKNSILCNSTLYFHSKVPSRIFSYSMLFYPQMK